MKVPLYIKFNFTCQHIWFLDFSQGKIVSTLDWLRVQLCMEHLPGIHRVVGLFPSPTPKQQKAFKYNVWREASALETPMYTIVQMASRWR